MTSTQLSERGQQLLKTLVQRYIHAGQPVGSKALLQESRLSVSAATVRNIMADLEERGYIFSPHTSSGRVPTARGYRFFVDSLITMQPPQGREMESLQDLLDPDKSPRELVESTSTLLSTITRQAGLVTLPRQESAVLRQVEFLPLSGMRVLVVLVINEREVQNRIIHTEREYSESELRQVANYINEHGIGRNLDVLRTELIRGMQADQRNIGNLAQTTADVASRAFGEDIAESTYVVAGQANLLEAAELGSMEQLRTLFEEFQRKKDILHLMDRCVSADGVQIFIGEESGFEMLGGFSVVTAPYQVSPDTIGVLGVIGPTRMAYERVIPIVDVTARMLSAALK
jgi:heat-inducible transcriptional repressor